MSKFLAASLGVAAFILPTAHAQWYSGDPYSPATTWPQYTDNLSTGFNNLAMTFDNFAWTGGNVASVGGHFHNFNSGLLTTIDTAHWEIRTGMSVGNAGTLVASGSGSATNSATTFTQGGWAVQRVDVDVPDFTLPSGNYWFGLAIGSTQAAGSGWFVAGTFGTNGIGGPLGDNDHLYYQENNSVVSWNYVDGRPLFPPGTQGFDPSYFINVPVPGTLALAAMGALAVVRRRR